MQALWTIDISPKHFASAEQQLWKTKKVLSSWGFSGVFSSRQTLVFTVFYYQDKEGDGGDGGDGGWTKNTTGTTRFGVGQIDLNCCFEKALFCLRLKSALASRGKVVSYVCTTWDLVASENGRATISRT